MPELQVSLQGAVGDRYRITREIGRGGMGTVFLATDTRYDREVAIKALRPEVADIIGSERFSREIETAARLHHPHILPLYDSGSADGLLYFVMPYVEGQSLRDLIEREGALPLEQALEIAAEVADALSVAHGQDIVHRDVKPENILLTGEHALLTDFGIALSQPVTERITDSGVILGTAQYMSPEQGTASHHVGPAADVYALGCVLFEMLTGEPPFSGRSAQAIIARHVAEKPTAVHVLRPGVPPDVEAIVTKALAKVPADRYRTATEFHEALTVRRPRRELRGWLSRTRSRVIVAGAVAFALAIGGWLAFGPQPLLHQADRVLVAGFEGPADDPEIGEVFRKLITTELDRSAYVRAVPRRDLNAVMRRAEIPETTFVDVALARQLAVRSAVRAIVVGSVERIDEATYSTVVHLMEAGGEGSLGSFATTGPDLVANAERLSSQLLEAAGEQREAIEAKLPLRAVMTPSFQAFRKYTQALALEARSDFRGARALLREALEEDPRFAAAWTALGAQFLSERQPDSARVAYARALELEDRLSPAQQYRARADVAWTIDGDLEGAINWYTLLLDEDPDAEVARNNRAILYSSVGRYEDAVADLEKSVKLNPFGPEIIQLDLLNLAAAYLNVGRTEDAEKVADDLTGSLRDQAALFIALARSDWQGVDSLARTVGDPSQGAFAVALGSLAGASVLAARGAVGDAGNRLAEREAELPGALARWLAHGRILLAMAHPVAFDGLSPGVDADPSPGGSLLRGLAAVASGDVPGARLRLDSLTTLPPDTLASLGAGPALLSSLVAAAQGRWEDAVAALRPVAAVGEHDALSLDRSSSFALRWAMGDAFDHLDRPDSAIAYFERVLEPTRIPPIQAALRGIPFSMAHYRLGELYRRAGNRESAARHLEVFLRTFDAPDSLGTRLREEARTMLAGMESRR